MPLLPYLKIQGDVVCLHVKAQPRAPRNEIGGTIGNELKVKIAAPPVDSAANEELVRFLAEVLGCPRGAVRLLRGQTSRHKMVALHGMTAEHVTAQLTSAASA